MISVSSRLPNDACVSESFIIDCTLSSDGKKMNLQTLIDTGVLGFGFIDTQVSQRVCDALGIEPYPLLRPKPIRGYDGKLYEKLILYIIYFNLLI